MLSIAAWLGWVVLAHAPVVPPPPPNPLEVELVWRAPPECPDADAIEARIRALLPGDPRGEGVLVVEGDISITDERARLVLVSTYQGSSERRELDAPDCHELGEATAVLIAIALEPARADEIEDAASPRVPEPTPAPSIASEPDVITPPPAVSTSTTTPAKRRTASPTAGALRLAAGIDAGGVPPPTAAVQAAAILEWKRARLELHGVWLVPRTLVDEGRGGTYQLGAAGLRGCGRLFHRAVEFPLCLGAEAGTVRGRSAIASSRVVHGPWLGALASAGVARAWGPVGIWSALEAVGRVIGSKFLSGTTVVQRQWPLSLRVFVGIEIRRSWIGGGRGQ